MQHDSIFDMSIAQTKSRLEIRGGGRAGWVAATFLFPLLIAACSDTVTNTPAPGVDAKAVLTDEANAVILATYVDLDTRGAALVQAVDNLRATTNETTLTAARDAWRAARRPWEQSEAFLFGPVETQGIDPGIDSWPVNKVDLDAVLNSDAVLTKEYIDGLEGTLKGFHTIEYLLFGSGTLKPASAITSRELEYLTAVSRSFAASVSQLRTAWAPTGGNYAAQVTTAGTQGSIYVSQKDALQELVNGMIGIADEVANGKINDPFTQEDRSLEESQFSNNSNSDFADNIRSIQNIYLGSYDGTTGKGITAIVAAKNSTLDARVKSEIEAAITAIGAMTPTFGEAITNNKTAVQAAQAAVRKVQQTLEADVRAVVLAD